MSEQTSEQRKVTVKSESVAVKQIQEFVDDYPLLSLAFVVAAGYALGRLISRL